MSRLNAWTARRLASRRQSEASFWPELCRRIDSGQLIPIISNNVFFDQLFDSDGDGLVGVTPGVENPHGWSIEEQLADAWAEEIGFPLTGRERMARVALYNRVVRSRDDLGAKTAYLRWLKETLLFLAEEDPAVSAALVGEQQEELEGSTFSDIAVELGLPRPAGQTDPLTHLARLRLPIYITTSPFDFLERAISANGRTPRTQVCFWSGEPLNVDPDHRTDYDLEPRPETPLVYHLFGLESYPESLVLTEDDYLDFLAAIAQDAHQQQPLLPWYLRQALTQSSLLLLGYRLRDWDFRILFRGLINSTPASLRLINLAIQVNPEEESWVTAADQIKRYLKGYFEEKERQLNFSVEYGTTASFVARLWSAWDEWRR